jgi:hypothetical protein
MGFGRMVRFAALATAVACSDTPQDPVSPAGPDFARGGASSSNPHFIGNATDAEVNPNPDLAVEFKISGVGSGVTVNVTVSATANLFQDCVNNGGKQPSAANKHFDTFPVEETQPLTATAGGNIEATFVLEFPAPELDCPPGQTLVTEGFWDDVLITAPIPSGGPTLTFSFPGDFDVDL